MSVIELQFFILITDRKIKPSFISSFTNRPYYIDCLELGITESEKERMALKGRAQLNVSNSRPDTYFAKDTKENKNVLVKGPYYDYETCSRGKRIQSIFKLYEKVNKIETNIEVLYPDLFRKKQGTRKRVNIEDGYFFSVYEDIYNQAEYKVDVESMNQWKNEKVINTDKTIIINLSFLYQYAIRYMFEIGDFNYTNFIFVEERAYNVDLEGIFLGKDTYFTKSQKEVIKDVYKENKEEVDLILTEWRKEEYRFKIVQKLFDLSEKEIDRIKQNISEFHLWLMLD